MRTPWLSRVRVWLGRAFWAAVPTGSVVALAVAGQLTQALQLVWAFVAIGACMAAVSLLWHTDRVRVWTRAQAVGYELGRVRVSMYVKQDRNQQQYMNGFKAGHEIGDANGYARGIRAVTDILENRWLGAMNGVRPGRSSDEPVNDRTDLSETLHKPQVTP